MYFKTIPSYDSDSEETKKTEDKKGDEESVDMADLGSWISNTRMNNRRKR